MEGIPVEFFVFFLSTVIRMFGPERMYGVDRLRTFVLFLFIIIVQSDFMIFAVCAFAAVIGIVGILCCCVPNRGCVCSIRGNGSPCWMVWTSI